MSDLEETLSSTTGEENKRNLSVTDGLPSNPVTWSEFDVAAWMNKCNLGQYASIFQENEIDGSVLMDDSFDNTQIQKLIPKIKQQLLFNKERKKLQASDSATTQSLVINKSEDSCNLENSNESGAVDVVQNSIKKRLPFLDVRRGNKANCKRKESERNKISLTTARLLEPRETVHSLPITNVLNTKASNTLIEIFHYLNPVLESDGFDPDFTTIVEEPINTDILLQSILRPRSIKSYIIDSLKRCHNLSDITDIFSSCMAAAEQDKAPELFLDIIEHVTKYVLTVCTIESLSYDSQRFLGNMIRKNGLPIPLAYYTCGEDTLQLKINFNPLAETLCYSKERILLCIGSPTAIGLGKTSVLPYLFENIRSDLLNTEGIEQLRFGCIDALFASFTDNIPYVVFDVHGTMTTMNEDLVTAIQHYCDAQMIFITGTDLEDKDFLLKTMNYSNETRTKPTMIVVFDSKYGEKNNTFSLDQFQQAFSGEGWCHSRWITTPTSDRIKASSEFNRKQQLQRLRQTLLDNFKALSASVHSNTGFRSIFAIQACFLAIKSTGSASSSLYTLEIEEKLKSLFNSLSDETNNLEKITPFNYLESEKLRCKKQLSELWEESSVDLQKRLEEIENQYQPINRIPDYTMFFIDLLTKHSYIDLLILERYLEQWRAQYEPPLSGQIRTAKDTAMTVMSQIKRLEEKLKQSVEQKKDSDEIKNIESETQMVKEQYKTRQDLIIQIEKQLSNIDITIGLFFDEIFALYEYLPKLFESDNLTEQLARKFAELMYKGFSFHVLRGRPLRCSSKLIQLSLQYVNSSTNTVPVVLTVIGEQSSAKSSLMNTTFGCNFRVSAGRCTLGMYLSVIRWRDQIIVILDTEGLLSLEESGSIFDNQMVTLAMLSSHIILINHKGEFSSNLEHLIGMSFYAKLQIHSPLKPKLLFILRDQKDTDTETTKIFFKQLLMLKDNLFNDSSKFLKSSIDDEIEINTQNVILLPNAFSNDFNPILKVEQIWRNGIFPMKINELRSIITKSLANANTKIYPDVPQLFQKIASNWDAIDNLGPSLLACKTLYELSAMNDLRSIAQDIVQDCIKAVHDAGRQNINTVLSVLTSENCDSENTNHLVNQFHTGMELTHNKIVQKAHTDYESNTDQTYYPVDIKQKVKRIIEPPISNMQGLLREEFDDRLYKARREARISNAQHRLMEVVQRTFDDYKSLKPDPLYKRIDDLCKLEIETCLYTLQQQLLTRPRITLGVLKFYNSNLQNKTANTTKGSIYNLLPLLLNIQNFQQTSEILKNIYAYVIEEREIQEPSKNSRFKRVKAFLRSENSDHARQQWWDEVYVSVECWFRYKHRETDNKKLLRKIIDTVLPLLRDDIQELVNPQSPLSSTDPHIITHLFTFIENVYQNQIIQMHSENLETYKFLSDIAVLALNILIDELFNVEQIRHEKEERKVCNDMKIWKENITTQISHMQDSFEQGKNMGKIVSEQIFKQTSSALLSKILDDVIEDIARSPFINHDTVQKQAYEESFRLGNGEKILKYILNINRYFCELSFCHIKPNLETAIVMHTRDAEQILMDVLDNANDTVQRTRQENVRLIADEIEKSIIDANILSMSVYNRFALNSMVSVPILNLSHFKQGFKTLREDFGNIKGRVAKLMQHIKAEAYEGCKKRISRQLGCQSRCPGCGSKCSLPEPHEEEIVEQWHECQCAFWKWQCSCTRPEPMHHRAHSATHHIAGAFFGTKCHGVNTPYFRLCYQHWMTSPMYVSNDERVFPLKKYYNQRYPEWYNNLQELSTTGSACKEDHPPPEQRRAWMIVRHVLLKRYASCGMVDQEKYDEKLYPPHPNPLPADFEVKWNDMASEET